MHTIKFNHTFPLEIGTQEFMITVTGTFTPGEPASVDEYGRPDECDSDDELNIETLKIDGQRIPYFTTLMDADILAKIEDKTRDEITAAAE